MSTTIVRGHITEEQFRRSDKFRGELDAFLNTETGAALLYILRGKTRAKGSKEPVPHEAIPVMAMTELSRLRGVDEMVSLIELLCEKMELPGGKTVAPALGEHDETSPFMPPKFEVRVPAKATPPTNP